MRSLRQVASTPVMEGAVELVSTLTVRAAEVLPDDVRVWVTRGALKVESSDPLAPAGATMLGLAMRGGMLQHSSTPESPLLAVTIWFGETLQGMVTQTLRAPWPNTQAKPHCAITSSELRLWWGGPDESEAEVALRPIPREDVRMEWPT